MSLFFKPHYWFLVSSPSFSQINRNDNRGLALLKLALGRLHQTHISIVIVDLGVMVTDYLKDFASPLVLFQVVFKTSLDEKYH